MQVDGNLAGDDGNGRNGGNGSEIPAAWARVMRRLRAELGEDVFASWFARLELENIVDGTARLTHPQLGTASTLLALAGTLSFSSELRALGRLVLKLEAELQPGRRRASWRCIAYRRHKKLSR